MQQRRPPAPGDERQQEQQAQRQPDVERVDVAPERPRIAAGHRPRDLVASPDLRDLRRWRRRRRAASSRSGRAVARREQAHLPDARPARVHVGDQVRMLLQRVDHARVLSGDRVHLIAGQPVAGGRFGLATVSRSGPGGAEIGAGSPGGLPAASAAGGETGADCAPARAPRKCARREPTPTGAERARRLVRQTASRRAGGAQPGTGF